MPAHNETVLLESSVRDVVDGLRARDKAFELMVVENGSTDTTLAIARDLAEEIDEVEVRTLPRPDYGSAMRTGLLESSGEIVVTFDVDYYDLDFLAAALDRSSARPIPPMWSSPRNAPPAPRTAGRGSAAW
jgi:glycosyltransferase involved in cell wall biosynthesis